jgi:hypothetical protein
MQKADPRPDSSKSKTKGKKVPMFISWVITLIMIMQSEIGLVSRNTMGWLILILTAITLIVLLSSFLPRRRISWSAGVRQRVWGRIKLTTTSKVSEMKV